jgi:hypothetical protein
MCAVINMAVFCSSLIIITNNNNNNNNNSCCRRRRRRRNEVLSLLLRSPVYLIFTLSPLWLITAPSRRTLKWRYAVGCNNFSTTRGWMISALSLLKQPRWALEWLCYICLSKWKTEETCATEWTKARIELLKPSRRNRNVDGFNVETQKTPFKFINIFMVYPIPKTHFYTFLHILKYLKLGCVLHLMESKNRCRSVLLYVCLKCKENLQVCNISYGGSNHKDSNKDFESTSVLKTLSHVTFYLIGVWRLIISSRFTTSINYYSAMERYDHRLSLHLCLLLRLKNFVAINNQEGTVGTG